MKSTHRLALALGLALVALSAPLPVLAQPSVAKANDAALTDGEVRKVDRTAGTVVLKHGEIRNIGMAPMTMEFKASDPKLLDGLKAGDKVRFAAKMDGNLLVVTRIDVQK
jgi:Cu/Ag efflux protein CusF